MGKSGRSSSWLSAVKKAFRSPSKDTTSDKRSSRSQDLDHQEQEKRRGKRRWSLTINSKEQTTIITKSNNIVNVVRESDVSNISYEVEKRDAIAMAMATAAAAKAAVATAQAAVEFMRKSMMPRVSSSEHQAAVVIQKIFRGYLKSLKTEGVFLERRSPPEHPSRSWVPDLGRHISILKTDERAWKCERDLAYAFSNKIWRSKMEEHSDSEQLSEWNERNQWIRQGRYSFDQSTPTKIVQVGNGSPSLNDVLKLNKRNSYEHNKFSLYSECSPLNKQIPSYQSIIKSCQTELKHLRVHSASPSEDELAYMKSRTPSLGGFLRSNTNMPSYMSETASTKARVRSQSAPRQQRPSKPEREGVGIPKRHLSFGAIDEEPSPSSRNLTRMQK